MTYVDSCILTRLPLSYLLHQLVMPHVSVAALLSFILHQGFLKWVMVLNSSGSNKHSIIRADNRKGFTVGSQVWGCSSSLQQLCLQHHQTVSVASQSFSTLLLCLKRHNNSVCNASKTESNRGSCWSSSLRHSNSKPGSSC